MKFRFFHNPKTPQVTVGPRDQKFREDVAKLIRALEVLSAKSQLLDNEQLDACGKRVRQCYISAVDTMKYIGVQQSLDEAQRKAYWDREYQRINDEITFGESNE